jgi:hypothetical protein
MNELNQNLLTGEQVVFETTKHWFAPIRASLIAFLILLGALVLRWLSPTGDGIIGGIGGLMDLVSTGLLIVALAWILYNIAEFLSAHFGVTNMRVLRYEGLIRRRSSETLLPTLTDVRLDEPAIGRNAKQLRTAIQEQKAQSLPGGVAPVATAPTPTPAPAAPATASSDPAAAFKALNDLHTQGLITDAEFEAKRQEIVGRI